MVSTFVNNTSIVKRLMMHLSRVQTGCPTWAGDNKKIISYIYLIAYIEDEHLERCADYSNCLLPLNVLRVWSALPAEFGPSTTVMITIVR